MTYNYPDGAYAAVMEHTRAHSDQCESGAYYCEGEWRDSHYFINLSGPKNWCTQHAAPGRSNNDCLCYEQVEVKE